MIAAQMQRTQSTLRLPLSVVIATRNEPADFDWPDGHLFTP